ncbi:MAG: zinc ribbon domain-containing protein [Gemmatimonadetes bacterium]|nr:zinc ribbon domain-containing protein [Gemmatimonadota bacterium]
MQLLLGLLLALLAVAVVLDPILRGRAPAPGPAPREPDEARGPQRKELALAALKEIEFDRATGKLSDADYERMRSRYTEEALAAIRVEDSAAAAAAARDGPLPGGSPTLDPVEALIASARTAAGGRRFCTECGAPLEGSGRFCVECGARL